MAADAQPLPNARGDRLYDLAEVLRSKNAGPLLVTFDVICPMRRLTAGLPRAGC